MQPSGQHRQRRLQPSLGEIYMVEGVADLPEDTDDPSMESFA